jgi:transcriptional regulator with XRE-family HTH domain
VAGWLGMTQAQVSRIENGPPIRNLDTLVFWAMTLRIPERHLWFDLPGAALISLAWNHRATLLTSS